MHTIEVRSANIVLVTWSGDVDADDADACVSWLSSASARASREGRRMAVLHDCRAIERIAPDGQRAFATTCIADGAAIVGVWTIRPSLAATGGLLQVHTIDPDANVETAKSLGEAEGAARRRLGPATPTPAAGTAR